MNQEENTLPENMAPVRALVEERKSRATSEIQAALTIAQKFPRDEIGAEARIMTACQRYSLAEQAVYAFPRDKSVVKGPSIRLAETLARHWGHLKFGFTEVENLAESSTVEAYCWDLASNVMETRTFTVKHERHTKKGSYALKDPRDIYENMANNASRRVRACILAIIPGDVVEKAVETCEKTLEKGPKDAGPLIDRVKKMVTIFGELSVNKEMLEKRLGHPLDQTSPKELANLTAIYKSIRDGQTDRNAWFDLGSAPEGGKAAEMHERLKTQEPKKEEASNGKRTTTETN